MKVRKKIKRKEKKKDAIKWANENKINKRKQGKRFIEWD